MTSPPPPHLLRPAAALGFSSSLIALRLSSGFCHRLGSATLAAWGGAQVQGTFFFPGLFPPLVSLSSRVTPSAQGSRTLQQGVPAPPKLLGGRSQETTQGAPLWRVRPAESFRLVCRFARRPPHRRFPGHSRAASGSALRHLFPFALLHLLAWESPECLSGQTRRWTHRCRPNQRMWGAGGARAAARVTVTFAGHVNTGSRRYTVLSISAWPV